MIQQSITPVEPVRLIIHGQTVRPTQEDIPKDLDIGSVAVSPADVCRSVPFGEEDVALVGVDHNGPGPLQIAQQGPPVDVKKS